MDKTTGTGRDMYYKYLHSLHSEVWKGTELAL